MSRPPAALLVAALHAAALHTAALLGPAALGAQERPSAVESPDLERIETLADAGRSSEARHALGGWLEAEGPTADRRRMVRARFLQARLAADADSAEMGYLWVAIDGGGPYGAAAWLRLAQLHLAREQPERALETLERLRAEHPGSAPAAESWLWTGHARESLGDLGGACEAWSRAAAQIGDGAAEAGRPATAVRRACEEGELRYAVQVGAFQAAAGAEAVRRRASDAGLEATIVREDGLHKVRIGRFASLESARAMVDRARRVGLSAIIVTAASP